MTIKAIETEYKGYRFRSRLEARWAVFFDALGLKWDYEPEGFVMSDGTAYLPDFRITHNTPTPIYSWVEIKHSGAVSESDSRKVYWFYVEKKEPIMIFRGEPFDYFSTPNTALFEQRGMVPVLSPFKIPDFHCPSYMGTLLLAGAAPLEVVLEVEAMDEGEYETIGFFKSLPFIVKADEAAKKARAARFEYGEKGGPA